MNTRMNVQFSNKQWKAIEELAEGLDSTKADVFKTALALLSVALREKRAGYEIGVIKDNKIVKKIIGI